MFVLISYLHYIMLIVPLFGLIASKRRFCVQKSVLYIKKEEFL